MKNAISLLFAVLFAMACNDSKEKENKNKNESQMSNIENPLFTESTLPYGAPDFSIIKNEHFKPAILEGIVQQKNAIGAIIANTEEPTFENTVLALEKSGELLNRSTQIF